MGADTKIEWATHTANAWIGCSKVSPACDHCYAERGSKRMGVEWGDDAYRRMTNWEPLSASVCRWDRAAREAGERHRVFWNSYSDFLESRTELAIRREWSCTLMEETPYLDHLILTKRPENALALLPANWMAGQWPKNIWFGTTAENQEQADKRIPELLKTPAVVRFISAEPLLGSIDLRRYLGGGRRTGFPGTSSVGLVSGQSRWHDLETGEIHGRSSGTQFVERGRLSEGDVSGLGREKVSSSSSDRVDGSPPFQHQTEHSFRDRHKEELEAPRLNLVIAGGESGPHARPMHPAWARSLRDQCRAAGVPFFFKQHGEWEPVCDYDGQPPLGTWIMRKVGKKVAGRMLDGRTWDEFPEVCDGR